MIIVAIIIMIISIIIVVVPVKQIMTIRWTGKCTLLTAVAAAAILALAAV